MLALLELVQHLAVAGSRLEGDAASGNFDVTAVEVERGLAAGTLGALDVRLGGDQGRPGRDAR